MQLELPDLQQGYVDLVKLVAKEGKSASPRGLGTRELLNASLIFHDASSLLPVGVGRKVSPAFNAAGAAQLIGGVNYHELLLRIAPKFGDFSADGIDRERYGPRSYKQVAGVVQHLIEDPHSREAIVTLQPPRTGTAAGGNVFPCTTSLQFFLREGLLHMVVNMRSNDVISGLSGDVWTFSQLHRTLAWVLGAQTGTYFHNAASLHIYETDLPRVELLHAPDRPGIDVAGFSPDAYSLFNSFNPVQRLGQARSWAREVLGLEQNSPEKKPAGVEWFYERLKPHWQPAIWCQACGEVSEAHLASSTCSKCGQ